MKKISDKLKFLLINFAIAVVVICGITIYVLYWLEDYTQHGISIAVPSFADLTEKEAHEMAQHYHLRVQVIDSIYDETAKPGTVLEQYPSVGSRIKENRLIHLTLNARNPEKLIFPNLQNAAYRQTLQTLETKGFNIGHLSYEPSEFKNLVLRLQHQGKDIQPGDLLSKGATIDIILGSGNGNNLVQVPQLTGKTLKEAIELIRKNYLNIEEIVPDGSITQPSQKYSAFVYEQYPEINSTTEAGSYIKLHITRKKEKISVSDSLMVTE